MKTIGYILIMILLRSTGIAFCQAQIVGADTLVWMKNSIPKPRSHRGFASVTNGTFLYVLGGESTYSASGTMSYVGFSRIQSDGSLGTWTETTPLPSALWESKTVLHDNAIYVIGGYTANSVASREVYKAQIGSDGSLSAWQNQNSLPVGLYGHISILYHNRVYIFGGWRNYDAYFSEIDANGNLGTWVSTTAPWLSIYASDAVVHNERIYLFGGKDPDTGFILSTTHYAELLPNGHLSEWDTTTPMPIASWFHRVVQYQNRVLVVGGSNKSNQDIQICSEGTIEVDGSIRWRTIGQIPTGGTSGNGLLLTNNHIYYLGGAYVNSIYYATLDITGIVGSEGSQPADFKVLQNYPNPFNPNTSIEFSIPKSSTVKLVVVDVLGREVAILANEKVTAGTFRSTWDGTNSDAQEVPSGIYFYRLTASPLDGGQPFVETKKMLLVR